MHEIRVDRLGGLSLRRKSVLRLTERPDMTPAVYCGRKTTKQEQHIIRSIFAVADLLHFALKQCPLS